VRGKSDSIDALAVARCESAGMIQTNALTKQLGGRTVVSAREENRSRSCHGTPHHPLTFACDCTTLLVKRTSPHRSDDPGRDETQVLC
jgi:hypothetical protein